MASPTRNQMAETDLKALAMAMYASREKDVQSHLVLLAIKTWTYLAGHMTMPVLRKIFNMTDRQLEPYLRKLIDKGWVVRNEAGYLSVTQSGDPAYRSIKIKIAMYINEITSAKKSYK